ncbi:MAG: 2-dehydropantoate 2-reductase [Paludibacter sp.]|nr:2-dehydropantoate 2-reductase [Paludibacter sp.]
MKTKIIIAGIGGVGGYYGGMLAHYCENNPDIDIYFVARGAHLQKMKEAGLKVIAEKEEFIVHPTLVTDNVAEIGIADYIILCTKSYDLAATVDQLKPAVGKNTVILPLLNGADISDRIRTQLPGIEVWDGCVYIVGRLNEPGVVESSGGLHDFFFGAEKGTPEKLQFMNELLTASGIETHLSDNIRMIIWRKFIFISTTASLTSYFNVGFRDLLTDPQRKETTLAFMNEVSAVAKAEGVIFDFDIVATTIRHIEKLPFGTTSSMHTDFQKGRNVELLTLTEVVIELGKKYNIPTPTYEIVYNALKK